MYHDNKNKVNACMYLFTDNNVIWIRMQNIESGLYLDEF